MILNRFRLNSIQKYINELLTNRNVIVSDTKVETVGVIVNTEDFSDVEAIKSIIKSLQIKDNKSKLIFFVKDEKEVDNSWDTFFYPKQFGWKGKINNTDLKEFINTPFSMLISYYNNSTTELNLVTAASKANFKVGITNNDERLFDLIIQTKANQTKLFSEELRKYLKQLNKL